MSAPTTLFEDTPTDSGTITLPEVVALSQIVETPGFNPRRDYGEHDGTFPKWHHPAATAAPAASGGFFSGPSFDTDGS